MSKKQTLICYYCKKSFKRYICWIIKNKSKYNFCSRECCFKQKKISLLGKNNPNFGNSILSKKYRGKNNPFYGKHHTQETKEKMRDRVSGENHYNWKNWASREEYGAEFDSALKEKIRFRDKYKCQNCGCSQLENGRKLDIHHIDYDKMNNILINLIALCIRCHRKTNHNRDYWYSYFRYIMKEKLLSF